MNVNLSYNRLLKFAALIAFIAAFCVAESWLTLGLWEEWVAGGLALTTAAEVL